MKPCGFTAGSPLIQRKEVFFCGIFFSPLDKAQNVPPPPLSVLILIIMTHYVISFTLLRSNERVCVYSGLGSVWGQMEGSSRNRQTAVGRV